jgi:hypothetical protein
MLWTILIINAILSLLMIPVGLVTYRYISSHSDGDGFDSGTSYTFHPYLIKKYSVLADDEFLRWYEQAPGTIVLRIIWCLVPGSSFLKIMNWIFIFLFPFICWIFYPSDKYRHECFNLDWTYKSVGERK